MYTIVVSYLLVLKKKIEMIIIVMITGMKRVVKLNTVGTFWMKQKSTGK